jgi:hypothetical protein
MPDEKKQEADRSAEQIFMPEPRTVKFLGHSIRLRPLPVAVAKELRRLPERLQKIMNETANNPSPEKLSETDFAAADVYVDAVYRLLQFYKIDLAKDELSEKATLTELKSLTDEQASVQGDEDFLFGPLRNTTKVFFPVMTTPVTKTETSQEGSS